MEKKTSLFENGLIWFGAGVSIAEILTGTYFASSGLWKRPGGDSRSAMSSAASCSFCAGVIGGRTGQKRHGDRESAASVSTAASCSAVLKCASAGGLDGHHDL